MDQPAWQKLLNKCTDAQETFNPNFVRWEGGEEGNVPVENDRVDRHTYFKFMTNLCVLGNIKAVIYFITKTNIVLAFLKPKVVNTSSGMVPKSTATEMSIANSPMDP